MRMRVFTAVLIVLVPIWLQSMSPVLAKVNQQAIDDVAAGKVTVARAVWWGFDPVESTKALQAAIDSGAKKVIVDNVGKPWIVDQMRLASNQELFFEKGVVVLAKQGAFKGTGDSLFRADMLENVTLRGYGATLKMRRADYAGPEYKKGEWRHVLDFRSCTNVRIYGLKLTKSGGDGIYLGSAGQGTTNKNVHIKDVICDRNYRQGISVITAEDLLIENCILRNTAGTAPSAGIDFEPNYSSERLVNSVMRNCISQNNAGGGYVVYLGGNETRVSLRFENCRSIGDSSCGAYVGTPNSPENAVRGTITFRNCSFERSGSSGVMVRNKPAGGCRVRFTRCSILDPAKTAPDRTPILFMAERDAVAPIGGVRFTDCLVRDARRRKPMSFVDMAGGIGLKDISGTLVLESKGRRSEIVLTDDLVANWMPAAAMTPIPRLTLAGLTFKPVAEMASVAPNALEFVRLRGYGHKLVLYAAEGDTVSFRVRCMHVAQYGGDTIRVTVVSPSGNEIVAADAPFEEETEVSFIAAETGVYHITANPGANYLQIPATTHPLLLNGEDGPSGLFGTRGELFFWVPAATSTFGVRVSGVGLGEAVRAALVDPRGKVVEEVDNMAATYQFEVNLPQPSNGEAWSVRLYEPTDPHMLLEDHYVDLRGIPPLLAASKEALLMPE